MRERFGSGECSTSRGLEHSASRGETMCIPNQSSVHEHRETIRCQNRFKQSCHYSGKTLRGL